MTIWQDKTSWIYCTWFLPLLPKHRMPSSWVPGVPPRHTWNYYPPISKGGQNIDFYGVFGTPVTLSRTPVRLWDFLWHFGTNCDISGPLWHFWTPTWHVGTPFTTLSGPPVNLETSFDTLGPPVRRFRAPCDVLGTPCSAQSRTPCGSSYLSLLCCPFLILAIPA